MGHPVAVGGATPAGVVPAKVRMPRVDALRRERLDRVLAQLWERRIGLVVAPAGWGKTSLLSQFAGGADLPTAWYRADHWDGPEQSFLSHLSAALAPVLGEAGTDWRSVDEALNAIAAWTGPRALLVVDDLHALEGTPAEAAFRRLVKYLSPNIKVLAASRSWPAINLPRLRVSEALVEIDADGLRFRSWEVERLFHEFYAEPIAPEELAQLARRTGGWAAGLQLFHLATRGKPPEEIRRILGALGGRSRLIREYLTTNVLEELPAELRDFLVETSVLGRLTAGLCDRLLQATGSQAMLDELDRRQLVSQVADDGGAYRSHDVLRAHLEAVLIDRRGEALARPLFRRAGMLLENVGALPEALHAYSRGESWSAADRLLAGHGERLIQGRRVWMDVLPLGMTQHDPWLVLATARQHRDDGRWAEAIAAYQRAERLFAGADAELICWRERQAVAAWLLSAPPPPVDWSTVVRAAVVRDPLAVLAGARTLSPVDERLATGLAHLLTGQLAIARAQLSAAAETPGVSQAVATGARLGSAVAALLAGDAAGERELDWIIEAAEGAGLTWLARMGRSALALTSRGDAGSEVAAVRLAFERTRDELSASLAALAGGAAGLQGGTGSIEGLEQAAEVFRRLGAGVLEAWARSLLALAMARAGRERAAAMALRAERLATASGAVGASYFAYLALAAADPERGARYREIGHAVQARTGLSAAFAIAIVPEPAPPSAPAPGLAVRCFGGLAIVVDGRRVDLGQLKPRARALLRLLAMNAGRPVHRETLQLALWPDMDPESAARNLHVAVSSLRRVLEPGAARGASRLLVRDGDAYKLVLPENGELDLSRFERALHDAELARLAGEGPTAVTRLREALDLYAGDLLPEDGPADWIVERRERYRAEAVRASQHLAELLLARGDLAAAADVAGAGLRLERYHDPLWRTLIEAHQRAGEPGAAARARRDYQRTLAELGLHA